MRSAVNSGGPSPRYFGDTQRISNFLGNPSIQNHTATIHSSNHWPICANNTSYKSPSFRVIMSLKIDFKAKEPKINLLVTRLLGITIPNVRTRAFNLLCWEFTVFPSHQCNLDHEDIHNNRWRWQKYCQTVNEAAIKSAKSGKQMGGLLWGFKLAHLEDFWIVIFMNVRRGCQVFKQNISVSNDHEQDVCLLIRIAADLFTWDGVVSS